MSAPLQLGDSGDAVKALQEALAAKGFSPGKVDGEFGSGTQAAVLAFQRSEELGADGVVGPDTAAALGLADAPERASGVDGVTTQIVSRMFPQTPLGNINANLPVVLLALVTAKIPDKTMILMALGTIRAETASFEPISEGRSRFNTSPGGRPFDLYDNMKSLGNQGAPDGANFCGRGFVQLTGRNNYTHYGKEIGQNLVDKPELANDPAMAAQLLARFLSDRESQIREALAQPNQNLALATARRLVNGGTHGIDDFTSAYTIGMQLIA